MAAVSEHTGTIVSPQTRKFCEVSKGYTQFRDGDVIWAKITPCMENGKAAVAHNLINGIACGSTEFFVLRSTGAVLPEFIYKFIRQVSYRNAAARSMSGAVGQARVTKNFLLSTPFALPPLAEQRRIVARLEKLAARSRRARAALDDVPPLLAQARQSLLAAAFRGRDVEKTYWAVVVPEPSLAEGRIDLALAKLPGGRGERMQAVEAPMEGASRAITDFRVLDAVRRRAAWLELKPLTGRTHQLRVHCAAGLGTPILGDGKYGGAAAHIEEVSGALHLHARALRLPHPEGGLLEAAAALPPHMQETFRFFGFAVPRTPPTRRLSSAPR